jgi:hypothetical protein
MEQSRGMFGLCRMDAQRVFDDVKGGGGGGSFKSAVS